MSPHDRRAAARRRAWGRGPMILKFEPLEDRELLAAGPRSRPDLVASSFQTQNNFDWGDTFQAVGTISNVGGGTTTKPFKVDVYASPGPAITRASIPIGEVIIPAGLASGASATFNQSFTLPGTPLPNTDQANQVFIDLRVNPDHSVVESNYHNNELQGQGFDTSVVSITPRIPANLIGTALGISPTSVVWGQQVNLTAQVTNNAGGDAPATRARVVLTPAGLTPGGPADVTIDSVLVPPIPAWQTVNVTHIINLPLHAPSLLAQSSQFTLSLVQDADFQTNTSIANVVAQGLGMDQAQIGIAPNPNVLPDNSPKPDLAAGTVQAPTTAAWGQTILVSTTVQNLGLGDAGPFRVRFLLAGANGGVGTSLFLADAQLSGLKAGFSQQVQQAVKIPGRLPNGLQVNGTGVARIFAEVDPENSIDESFEGNNLASSGPIVLRLLGTDGTTTVPTQPTSATVLTSTLTGTPAPTGRKIRTALKNQKHGLKAFPAKVGHELSRFFKDVGRRLSVSGGSHTSGN